jgi:hypothetical protein
MWLNLVGLFLLRAIVWFVAWLFVWYHLGSLITLPVSIVTKSVVALFFPSWAEGVEQSEATLTLITSLAVPGMIGVPVGQVAVFSPEVGFLKYGYGLPLLIALLFASDAKCLFTKVCIGAVALLPFQVFGVCFDWLKQLAIETGAVSFSPMARELIAFGYQFGYLVLPALVPVLLWAAMDRRFLATILMEAALEGSVPDSGGPKGRG